MCIHRWGTRTLSQGCTTVSLDYFPLVSCPLSSLINNCWICHWNSGKVTEAEWGLFSVIKEIETQACAQELHRALLSIMNGITSFFFYDWVVFHYVNIPLLFLSIHLSMDIYIATMWAIRKPMLGKHQWSKTQPSLQRASSVVLLNWGVQQSNKKSTVIRISRGFSAGQQA